MPVTGYLVNLKENDVIHQNEDFLSSFIIIYQYTFLIKLGHFHSLRGR